MILVTGGTGAVGRAVASRLARERLPCVVLGGRDFDLAGGRPLHAAVGARPSCIVHLAAAVPRPPGVPDDDAAAARTRRMDRTVLEALQHWNCDALYASGCSLYARGRAGVRTEDEAPLVQPQQSAYLAAKQEGEREFLACGRATVLRISAPLGPGLSPEAVAMRFLLAARSGRPIPVWGSGTREQNYVDTDDIADAVFRALVVRPRTLINIAAAEPVTMRELADAVVQVLGRGEVVFSAAEDPREGEPARYAIARAEQLLGWKPATPLRRSLQRMEAVAP